MLLQPPHVPEPPGRDVSWAACSAITPAPPRAPGPASPAGGLVVRQLQQLRGGVGQVPLPAALQLCHILSGLVMDLNGLSGRSYPDRDPLTHHDPPEAGATHSASRCLSSCCSDMSAGEAKRQPQHRGTPCPQPSGSQTGHHLL